MRMLHPNPEQGIWGQHNAYLLHFITHAYTLKTCRTTFGLDPRLCLKVSYTKARSHEYIKLHQLLYAGTM